MTAQAIGAPAYTIAADGKSITCHRCHRTSYNANDVVERYCGYCKVFHDDHCREFDCTGCGRHIIAICGPPSENCAACQSMPGWFDDPEIARIIDPDYFRHPPRDERQTELPLQ